MSYVVFDVQCWDCKGTREELLERDQIKSDMKMYCPDCKRNTPHSLLPSTPSFTVEGGYSSKMKF